jgi:hypothetical protein
MRRRSQTSDGTRLSWFVAAGALPYARIAQTAGRHDQLTRRPTMQNAVQPTALLQVQPDAAVENAGH